MIDAFEAWKIQATYPVFIVALVWAINWFWRRQTPTSSILLWQLICKRMSEKVLPDEPNSRQATISGTLGLLITLLPVLVIVFLIYQFASYQWLFDGLLLYVAADFANVETNSTIVSRALHKNQKQYARDMLQKNLLRETQQLSLLGLIKANIESYALRYQYQQTTVFICYLVLGPVFALAYRLIFEAASVINQKCFRYNRYSAFSFTLAQTIQYFPVKIGNLLLLTTAIFTRPLRGLNLLASPVFWYFGGAPTIATSSYVGNRKLGGPVMRDGGKIRRSRFDNGQEPGIGDIERIKVRFRISTAVMLVISYGIFWIVY